MNASGESEMFCRAPTRFPDHTCCMGIIHHEDRAVFFRKHDEFWKRRNISVHTEDPVRHDQRALRIHVLLENALNEIDVFVRIDNYIRRAQAASVNNARMVQAVAQDNIAISSYGW